MLIFPREGDQRSRSRSQPSCSWEGACEGEGPNFVSSNGALVSFLILCNTSSSTDVSRITIHFMKNLRLLAAESLSPLVVGLFSSLSYGTRASWLSRIFCFLCILHLSFKNPFLLFFHQQMWQTTGGLFFNYKISAQVFRKQESCCWSKGMPLVKVASYFPVRWSLYLDKVKAPDWSSLVQQEEEERIIYYESAGICSSIGIGVRIEYIETDCLVA
ncbi:unnamed protein product [Vicia faba]|uniref:Uncharacterized protein n=1 Tax=Vicia faba TaxID=3906 RepID=R4IUB5_VICFA|nr:hypothetical protein [Vicia faba]CAI8615551.1 unnamed protein product [Vicia faba]